MEGELLNYLYYFVLIIFWFYWSICLLKMGNKLNLSHGWMAFIPILSEFYELRIAGKSFWYLLLILIPIFGYLILFFIVWANISKRMGRTGWVAALFLIPGVGLIVPGYLAFSNPKLNTLAQ